METNQNTHTITVHESTETSWWVCDSCEWQSSCIGGPGPVAQEIAEHEALAKGGAMADLARTTFAIRYEQDGLTYRVVNARDSGASWAEIGALLGVSRQAAHAKYGPICQ